MKHAIAIAISILFLSGCAHNSVEKEHNVEISDSIQTTTSQSWALDKLINFNNKVYVGTNENVPASKIQENLGLIKYSSDEESTIEMDYFSNYYPVGTNLYKVKDRSIQDVIAVEVSKHTFVLAQVHKV
ncbi:hypothetical protein ACFSR7_25200 [Cohnella sp. GCM10020058]|uniref:hypothetical protein n=1 Tax=Cohnella sp. GCM10020058 TaxID=3317330 RepID=UPI003637FDB4